MNQKRSSDFEKELIFIFDRLEKIHYKKEYIAVKTKEKNSEILSSLKDYLFALRDFLLNTYIFKKLSEVFRRFLEDIPSFNKKYQNISYCFWIVMLLLSCIALALQFYDNLYFSRHLSFFIAFFTIFVLNTFLLYLSFILSFISSLVKAKQESERLPRKIVNLMRKFAGIPEEDETQKISQINNNLILARQLGKKANLKALEYANNCVNQLIEDSQAKNRVNSEIVPLILSILTITGTLLIVGEPFLQHLENLNNNFRTILGLTIFSGLFLPIFKIPFILSSPYEKICKKCQFILQQAQVIKVYLNDNENQIPQLLFPKVRARKNTIPK
jgi:hypothetical protein